MRMLALSTSRSSPAEDSSAGARLGSAAGRGTCACARVHRTDALSYGRGGLPWCGLGSDGDDTVGRVL
eukprot:2708656-Pleurochrysis_carterae.AAC.3